MSDTRKNESLYDENDLLTVLLTVKSNILRDLKVASLGVVKEIEDNNYIVKLFPLLQNENDKTILCFKLKDITIVKDDIVLILFTDRNFIQNLKQIKLNQTLTKLTENYDLHSHNYGIIIGKL